jgi:hypothetical protein
MTGHPNSAGAASSGGTDDGIAGLTPTELRRQAREAIERGDRRQALLLLRHVAEGQVDGSKLGDMDAGALIAVAAEQSAPSRERRRELAMQALQAKRSIVDRLRSEAFDREDLLEILALVNERLDELEHKRRREIEQL